MKSPEFNDVIPNSPINTLGLEYFTFYETSDNVLFEYIESVVFTHLVKVT